MPKDLSDRTSWIFAGTVLVVPIVVATVRGYWAYDCYVGKGMDPNWREIFLSTLWGGVIWGTIANAAVTAACLAVYNIYRCVNGKRQ